jgi:hypothetical protein
MIDRKHNLPISKQAEAQKATLDGNRHGAM